MAMVVLLLLTVEMMRHWWCDGARCVSGADDDDCGSNYDLEDGADSDSSSDMMVTMVKLAILVGMGLVRSPVTTC